MKQNCKQTFIHKNNYYLATQKGGKFMAVCWSFQRSAHSRPVGPTGQWQTSDPTYEPLWADLWKEQHTAIRYKSNTTAA